jgi:uncharacterized protein YcbX
VPRLAGIFVYPIKSLDGVALDEARIGPHGALEGDRRFAVCDATGAFVNAKRTPAMHTIRAAFGPGLSRVGLSTHERPAEWFDLEKERASVAAWLTERLGFEVGLVENRDGGFPDDVEASGPTVVSTATLEVVAEWFPGLDVAEVRRRFRANLEIGEAPPFWEDSLYSESGPRPFLVGEVRLFGLRSSRRCVVPTRSAHGGRRTPRFQKLFAQRREETLPSWAPRSMFDHYYRLATNTIADPTSVGRRLQVFDSVQVDATVRSGDDSPRERRADGN